MPRQDTDPAGFVIILPLGSGSRSPKEIFTDPQPGRYKNNSTDNSHRGTVPL